MAPVPIGLLPSVIHPPSETQAGILHQAEYPVSQRLTNLIVASPLVVLDRQSKLSTKTHKRPLPRSPYILVSADRAIWTRSVANPPRMWARTHPLSDWMATLGLRDRYLQAFPLAQRRPIPLPGTLH
jgi:hypothetical protein